MTHLQPAPENDWHPKAACRGHDPDLWFGWEGESINAREAREQVAKRICATCPVRTQCLTHALTYPEAYGIWGGLNEHELVAERCRRGLKPAPRSDYHRLITCAGCNNTKPHNGRGPDGQPLCAACRFRWVQAGRPATVPPPPTRKEAA
jgi:Transcription factor WhiB.